MSKDMEIEKIRHWSKIKKNFFYLVKVRRNGPMEIWKITSTKPMIKAERYSLKGEVKKWANREKVNVIPLGDLQTLGVLPDSLGNFARDYWVSPLDTIKMEMAVARVKAVSESEKFAL